MITPEDILRDQAENRYHGPVEQQMQREAAGKVLAELDAARARVAELEAENELLDEIRRLTELPADATPAQVFAVVERWQMVEGRARNLTLPDAPGPFQRVARMVLGE
jgi:hypothetical protein